MRTERLAGCSLRARVAFEIDKLVRRGVLLRMSKSDAALVSGAI